MMKINNGNQFIFLFVLLTRLTVSSVIVSVSVRDLSTGYSLRTICIFDFLYFKILFKCIYVSRFTRIYASLRDYNALGVTGNESRIIAWTFNLGGFGFLRENWWSNNNNNNFISGHKIGNKGYENRYFPIHTCRKEIN